LGSQSSLITRIPVSEANCQRCRTKDFESLGFILARGDSTQTVEVVALENQYLSMEGIYRVRAKLRWKCPKCGLPLEEVKGIRDIPVSIVKEMAGECRVCGGNLVLGGEKIALSSLTDFEDIVILTGYLSCSTCSRTMPLSVRLRAAFRPVWKYLSTVKKVKIARDGVEFERTQV
jgi:hypothetical protein